MLFSQRIKFLSSFILSETSYFSPVKSLYTSVRRNVIIGHFYVKDKNDNRVILTKSKKVLSEEEIMKSYSKGEINEIEKDFLLRSRQITPINIQLYRFLHDEDYVCGVVFKLRLGKFLKKTLDYQEDIITILLEASAIATAPSGNIEQAINLLDEGKQKFASQIENLDHAKHLLTFYHDHKKKKVYFPIGYFLKFLSPVIKSTLLAEKEPPVTKLESRHNTFVTRFLYELEPWVFKDWMSNIPKIGQKRREGKE